MGIVLQRISEFSATDANDLEEFERIEIWTIKQGCMSNL